MTNTPAAPPVRSLTPSSAKAHSASVMRPRTPLDRSRIRLSVLMPVFNEQATIESIINYVHAAPIAPIKIELVVVDDYSTDGSREVLQRLHAEGRIHKLHLQPHNQGKGAAIRQALGMSTGDIVIVQDADLEYDPADWPVLLAPIIDGKADACFGSRFLGGPHRVLLFWHSVGNTLLTMFSNMLTNLNLTDMETCYKAMRGDVARTIQPHLRSDRFGFEPEITARLAKAHARIFEVPISYSGRTYAEGKKINWKDGVAAFWHIFKYNLLS
jgi:glycosyltransferase involved in cell wall biosynthesis